MAVDGINVHLDTTHAGLVKSLGCRWARIDIYWWTVETSPGKYSWSQTDRQVETYTSAGLQVYATLMGTPAWHRASITDVPDPAVWARFCAAAAKRYGRRISVYSMWNEPNLGKTFWKGTPKQFCQTILAPGGDAVKSVNPGLMVAAPDLATTGKSDWPEWLSELKHHVSHFDITAIHSYHDEASTVRRCFVSGKVPILSWLVPKWRSYNQYLKKVGKPVFLTETGLEAKYGSQKEMDRQAKFTRELQSMKGEMGVQEIFFYTLADAPAGLEAPFGFYTSDWLPKTVVHT